MWVKPWGTAHAVWMAAPVINEPFGIVNADDFYGKNSLKSLATHLESLNDHELTGCMVGYELEKTITDNGTVSRGVCEIDEQQYLKEITERTAIARGADGNIYYEEKVQASNKVPPTRTKKGYNQLPAIVHKAF